MFGLIRPGCGGHDGDRGAWTAHMCGVCSAARGGGPHPAGLAVNTDAIALSSLVEALTPGEAERVAAGRCPLRGMRTADIVPATSPAAAYGAAVSLALAAAKARDLRAEREAGLARVNLALAATAGAVGRGAQRRAEALMPAGAASGGSAGAADVLGGIRASLARQAEVEAAARAGRLTAPGAPGQELLRRVTAPTADATALAFAGAFDVARPGEHPLARRGLAEAGSAFGALAHLLDAVEDREADREAGAFNPLDAVGLDDAAARREADELLDRLEAELAGVGRETGWSDGGRAERLIAGGARGAAGRIFAGHRPPRTTPGRVARYVAGVCTGYYVFCRHEDACTGQREPSVCGRACEESTSERHDYGCCSCCCEPCD
ncbi:hypothetical protein [Corynebacterium sp. 335C]